MTRPMNVSQSQSAQVLDDLEDVYRLYFHRFLRLAESITRDVELARDAVHDGFAQALRHRQTFRGDSSLATWVGACVVRAALSSRRRRQSFSEVAEDAAITAALEARDSVEGSIQTAVVALPERQRLALFLRYYADFDYRQIADILEVELGTVSATLHKAHAALRAALTTEVTSQ